MTKESVSKKPDPTTTDKKPEGNPGTEAKKTGDNTPTPEGQKRVTDNYRRGWRQIWKGKH